jgi:DNA-directed RNA polymerase specialized sigma24 family protein
MIDIYDTDPLGVWLLFNDHRGTAIKAAVKYVRTRPWLSLDDMIQECLIVLYRAALNFKPNGKAHFARYSKVCIDFHLRGFWKGNVDQQRQVSLDEPVGRSEEGEPQTRADVHEEREAFIEVQGRAAWTNQLNRISDAHEFILTNDVLTLMERAVLKLHFIQHVCLEDIAKRVKQPILSVRLARLSGIDKMREHFQLRGFKVSTEKVKTDLEDMYSNPRERLQLGAHVGFHVKRGVINPKCIYCAGHSVGSSNRARASVGRSAHTG